MSFHARPIPTPAHMPGGRHETSHAPVSLRSPMEDPPATPPPPRGTTFVSAADALNTLSTAPAAADVVDAAALRVPTPDRRDEVPTPAARDTPWPWYRREPWFPVALATFVPVTVAFVAPQEFRALLLGVSGLLLVLSIAMLIRQGLFKEHPRPTAALDHSARSAERRV